MCLIETHLLVHKVTESGLGLDDDIRHIHLAAQGRQPNDQLDRVDIVGDDNELGLLGLNELSDVVKTILHNTTNNKQTQRERSVLRTRTSPQLFAHAWCRRALSP